VSQPISKKTNPCSKLLKIALVSVHGGPLVQPGAEGAGGQNVYVREVARELSLLGHEVHVFTRGLHHTRPEILQVGKVRVIRLPAGPAGHIGRDGLFDYLPEFLQNMSAFTGYDVIHTNYWLSGWVGMQYAKRFNLPQVHTHHRLGEVKSGGAVLPEKVKAIRYEVEAETMKQCAAIIATSAQEIRSINSHYPAAQKIELVPCGVDTNRFYPRNWQESRQALGLPITEPILLYVGRFHPQKGIDTFLEAAALTAKEKNVRIVLVGGCHKKRKDAQNFQEVRIMVGRLGLTHCTTFLGNLDHDLLPLAYSAADICVVPSLSESFGMVAIESMACGTPVVASRIGGLRYTVRDRETGLLVPAKNPQAFAEAVEYLLDNSALRSQFGHRGLRSIQQRFTWTNVAKSLANLYNNVESRVPTEVL
jgi:D-inositol-3-phosphate glycosyltransferase